MSLRKALEGRKAYISKQENYIDDQITEHQMRVVKLEAAKLELKSRYSSEKTAIDTAISDIERATLR